MEQSCTPRFRARALPSNPCKTMHDDGGSTTGKRTYVLSFKAATNASRVLPNITMERKPDNACNAEALDPSGQGKRATPEMGRAIRGDAAALSRWRIGLPLPELSTARRSLRSDASGLRRSSPAGLDRTGKQRKGAKTRKGTKGSKSVTGEGDTARRLLAIRRGSCPPPPCAHHRQFPNPWML